ncbi:hypothetical protein [Nonomuraea sp. NPDC049750]|uniref:hypothetical protein n=1 Tax=Nonomuraea sp. NPDC049750 TaxID=3154738 RepID=UPI0033F1850C
MASAVEHYREGERLLAAAVEIPLEAAVDTSLSLEERREASAMAHATAAIAQAHFTAALAAATALLGAVAGSGYDDADLDAWREAGGTKPARHDGPCACDHHGDHAGCDTDCECAR